jgi:hypothetical protein
MKWIRKLVELHKEEIFKAYQEEYECSMKNSPYFHKHLVSHTRGIEKAINLLRPFLDRARKTISLRECMFFNDTVRRIVNNSILKNLNSR